MRRNALSTISAIALGIGLAIALPTTAVAEVPAVVEGEVRLGLGAMPGITVYADLDGDGVFDPGEPSDVSEPPILPIGFPGAPYRIEGIPAGPVDIRVVNPDPAVVEVVFPPAGFHSLTVADGVVLSGVDFTFDFIPPPPPPAMVEGHVRLEGAPGGVGGVTVYADLDGDGEFDEGEPFDVSDAPLIPFPLSGGEYLIEGIPAGPVDIRVVNPEPTVVEVVFPPGGFHSLVVADGVVLSGVDFTFDFIPPPAVVEGHVRLAGAPGGVGGVTVYADLDGDGEFDEGEPFDVSDEPLIILPFSGGEYQIEGIPAGPVDIRVVNPEPTFVEVTFPSDGFYSLVVADGDVISGVDFTFDFIPDVTPPVPPTPPGDLEVQCAADVPAPIDLTAVDDRDGEITASPTAVVTGESVNQFIVVRTWTFTDSSGNSSSVSQTITVSDTMAPVAPPAPPDVIVVDASAVPPAASLVATDNCDGAIPGTLSETIVPGASIYEFSVVRTWTFTDLAGNASQASQTITVEATPEQHFEVLDQAIDDLVAGGELKPGQARGLLRPLSNALKKYAEGKVGPACSQLADFVAEVEAKRADGALSAAEADALIARANDLRGDIGCFL